MFGDNNPQSGWLGTSAWCHQTASVEVRYGMALGVVRCGPVPFPRGRPRFVGPTMMSRLLLLLLACCPLASAVDCLCYSWVIPKDHKKVKRGFNKWLLDPGNFQKCIYSDAQCTTKLYCGPQATTQALDVLGPTWAMMSTISQPHCDAGSAMKYVPIGRDHNKTHHPLGGFSVSDCVRSEESMFQLIEPSFHCSTPISSGQPLVPSLLLLLLCACLALGALLL